MRRILTVLTLAVVVIALPLSALYGSNSIPVSGTASYEILPNFECERLGISDNFICTEYLIETWSRSEGSDGIDGVSSVSEARWAIHDMVPCDAPDIFCVSPCIDDMCYGVSLPDFSSVTWCNAHEIHTFPCATVTVEGKEYTGSLSIQINFQTEKGGTWVIISGAVNSEDGTPVNIRGSGTMSLDGSYSGQIHFDQ